MVTSPTGSPTSIPPDQQQQKRSTSVDASTPPAPPSLAAFSFSQFLAWYDDDGDETSKHTTAQSTLRASITTSASEVLGLQESPTKRHDNRYGDGPLSHLGKPATSVVAPLLSLHDCVVVKLCCTCALCKRLLRHQPAAIETCGHCFCYSCINRALEDGCAPLAREWPWSTLSSEVHAATERWLKDKPKQAPQAMECKKETASPPASASPPPMRVDEGHPKTIDELDDKGEVVVTMPSTIAATASLSARAQKPRKVQQKCPLCLGPAFKWMLVTVPPVAELCTKLAAAYPSLEDMLTQLTQDGVGAAISPRTTSIAPPRQGGSCERYARSERDAAHGKPLERQQGDVSTAAEFVTTAFASVSQEAGSRQQPISHSNDSNNPEASEEEDEEALRRRRRSSGGPRKEITFADEILPHLVAKEVAPATVPATDPPIEVAAEGPPATPPRLQETLVNSPSTSSGSNSMVAHPLGSSTSSNALPIQLSVDLIPSPDAPIMPTLPPRALELHNAEVQGNAHRELAGGDSELDAMGPLHVGMLGQSPEAAARPQQQRYEKHQRATDAPSVHFEETLTDASSEAVPPPTSTPTEIQVTAVSSTPYFDGSDGNSASKGKHQERPNASFVVPSLKDTCQTHSLSCTDDAATEYVLLDTSSLLAKLAPRERRSSKREERVCRSCGTEVARITDAGFLCVCDSCAAGEAADKGSMPYSSVRSLSHEACVMSVHTDDAWKLDAALVRCHRMISNCYAVLRVGHLFEQTAHRPDGVAEQQSVLLPLCVAGNYPLQPALDASLAPHASAEAAGGARILPALSPAACTALILSVPCIDRAWFTTSSLSTTSWLPYAVTGWRDSSGSVVNAAKRNAFRDVVERVAGVRSPVKELSRAGSWMSHARSFVLSQLTPWQETASLRRPLSALAEWSELEGEQTPKSAYYFFVLPDGAVAQLAKAMYDCWTDAKEEHQNLSDAVTPEQRQLTQSPPHFSTRKRSRETEGGDEDNHRLYTSDGHSLRAWRRLLLDSGAGCVEISASLFGACVEACTEAELESAEHNDTWKSSTNIAKGEVTAARLARHLRSAHSSSMRHWVHVDVANDPRGTHRNSGSAAAHSIVGNSRSLAAHALQPTTKHTLLVLYSTAMLQEACAELLATERASEPVPPTASSSQQEVWSIKARLRHFHAFLDRIAACVAMVLQPVLLSSSNAQECHVSHEVRPANWLLENIAEGRRSAGNCAAPPTRPNTRSADAAREHQHFGETAGRTRSAASSQRQDVALHETQRPPSSSSNAPPQVPLEVDKKAQDGLPSTNVARDGASQRVGVYRSLLYSDTP